MISRDIEFAAGRRELETLRSYRAFRSRSAQLQERPILTGYVVKFSTPTARPVRSTRDGTIMHETILPGAFAASLASGENIRAVLLHEDQWEVGRTEDYSLLLREDAVGLLYRLSFDHETRLGRLLYNWVDHGSFSGLSFKFNPIGSNGVFYSGGSRVLVNVRLHEITFSARPRVPAYQSGTALLSLPVSVLRKRLDAAMLETPHGR